MIANQGGLSRSCWIWDSRGILGCGANTTNHWDKWSG
jgi:hypothetical protein